MDVHSLGVAAALVSLSLALLEALFAGVRRRRTFFIFLGGYLAAAAGFLLSAFGGTSAAAALLILFLPLSLAWGIRLAHGIVPAWPRRFWAYLPAVAVLLLVFRRVPALRDMTTTLAFLVFLSEFMGASLRGIVRPNPLMRAAVWILGLSFALVLALFRVLGSLPSTLPSISGPALESWGLLAAIGYLVAWGGLVLLLDLQGLLAELERQNRELNEIAVTDALTGFLNRRLLQSNMVEEMERATRFRQSLSLILFDLDHFKGVNDNFGHQTGDAVLTQVAGIANSTIRKSDKAYRWGGEEFLLVLPNTSREGAYHLAEKLRRAVSSAVFPVVGSMTISLGVAEWGGAEDMDHWFRRLDLALYRAKNCGRNRVEYIEPGEDLEGAVFKIVWQADWSSGNGIIDGQHKKLLDLCNVLLGRSLSHAQEGEIRRLLDSLNELCIRHFADEEEILKEIGYPERGSHMALHRKLLSDAADIRARVDSGEGATAGEYFDFLVDTVVMRHIVKEDALFFPYLKPPEPMEELPVLEGGAAGGEDAEPEELEEL